MLPHLSVGANIRAVRIFLIQSFQVWCEVQPRFSRSTFQASPAKRWNSLICVQRDNALSLSWRIRSSVLIAGLATVNWPLCD
jgi:hypothetical protein